MGSSGILLCSIFLQNQMESHNIPQHIAGIALMPVQVKERMKEPQ